MRLDYLKLHKFKNLGGFSVDFDEECSEPITVILGRNGTGKSNLFEALVIIFRDLLQETSTPFGYDLRYTMKNGAVRVRISNAAPEAGKSENGVEEATAAFTSKEGNPIDSFSFVVTANGVIRRISKKSLLDGANREFLPRHVFAYYSGSSKRLEEHFFKPQLSFRNELLAGRRVPLRPLFYAKPIHSHFVLLSFFIKEDREALEFLRDYFWIEELESILFVLRRPHWASGKQNKAGDERFWGAKGVVSEFLDKLYSSALAPLRLPGRIQHSFDEIENTEFLYLYLRDLSKLMGLASQSNSAADFFKELESTFISDLIHETRIRVKVRHAGGLTFRELSEGEQQLLTVIGLLRFTNEEESLFLLDEPDTHLNPSWGMEYMDILGKHTNTGTNSHCLVATHDPLALTNLRKNQVVVMERDETSGQVIESHPNVDPIGLGITGILRNYFGLRTTLDTETQAKLDDRFQLLGKGDDRTQAEDVRLRELSRELAYAGFANEFRDPNYELFAKAMATVRQESGNLLSTNDIQHLEQQAVDIARRIIAQDKR